jgi:hypothetical protein
MLMAGSADQAVAQAQTQAHSQAPATLRMELDFKTTSVENAEDKTRTTITAIVATDNP